MNLCSWTRMLLIAMAAMHQVLSDEVPESWGSLSRSCQPMHVILQPSIFPSWCTSECIQQGNDGKSPWDIDCYARLWKGSRGDYHSFDFVWCRRCCPCTRWERTRTGLLWSPELGHNVLPSSSLLKACEDWLRNLPFDYNSWLYPFLHLEQWVKSRFMTSTITIDR